jgi:hypothetical protein
VPVNRCQAAAFSCCCFFRASSRPFSYLKSIVLQQQTIRGFICARMSGVPSSVRQQRMRSSAGDCRPVFFSLVHFVAIAGLTGRCRLRSGRRPSLVYHASFVVLPIASEVRPRVPYRTVPWPFFTVISRVLRHSVRSRTRERGRDEECDRRPRLRFVPSPLAAFARARLCVVRVRRSDRPVD